MSKDRLELKSNEELKRTLLALRTLELNLIDGLSQKEQGLRERVNSILVSRGVDFPHSWLGREKKNA